MTKLEEIIQRMIDAGESEESIKIVIESYQANPVKTEGSATGVDALPGKKTTPMGTVLDGENGLLDSPEPDPKNPFDQR